MWGDQFCVAEIQPEGAGEASVGERIGQPLSLPTLLAKRKAI